MRLTEKIIKVLEEKLGDSEASAAIKEKIIAPSLTLLAEELNRAGADESITTLLRSVLWPIAAMMVTIVVLLLVVFNMQVLVLYRTRHVLTKVID